MSMGLFKGIKQPGPGVEHSSFSSAEDKKRVEYSFSGPSWPEIGRTALLPLICSNSPRIRLSLSLSHTHTHTQQLYSTNSDTCLFSQMGESLASEMKCLMKCVCCLFFCFVVTVFYTGYTKRHSFDYECVTPTTLFISELAC